MEKEMRNDPIYKVLKHLWDENPFGESVSIRSLRELIQEEAPEIYELFEKDYLGPDDCDGIDESTSPAGWSCPEVSDEEDHRMSYSQSRSVMADPDTNLYNCPVCNILTDYRGPGVCANCDSKGYWIDPAGGVHQGSDEDEFYDPASMYE